MSELAKPTPLDICYPEEKTALFIDGPNLYAAARALGFDIDYRKLLHLFARYGRLLRAFYYTAVSEEEFSPIRPLVDWLDYNGYTMVTKPTKEFADPVTGRRRIKGNMDIELAIDMMEMAAHLDHAVLFSGDGDFRRLTEAVQRKGVRVTVISTMKSQPPMISDDLRRQADQFIELLNIQSEIQREFFGRDTPPYVEPNPSP